jgi:alpha-beta hydrolase superfamily lysophospholipase
MPSRASRWHPGMVERIQLKTKDNLTLAADFFPPKPSDQLAPGIILVHHAGGQRRSLEPLAERLQRSGFGVVSLDMRGHGESVSASITWEGSKEAQQELWSFSTRDIDAAAEFLRDQKSIHSTNLSLLAHGNGGALAVRHAGRDENVRAVALINPCEEPQFGFNISEEVADLAGLPTLVVVSKVNKSKADELASNAHKANHGDKFIEIMTSKVEDGEILADSKLSAEITNWLKEKAFPKRSQE